MLSVIGVVDSGAVPDISTYGNEQASTYVVKAELLLVWLRETKINANRNGINSNVVSLTEAIQQRNMSSACYVGFPLMCAAA